MSNTEQVEYDYEEVQRCRRRMSEIREEIAAVGANEIELLDELSSEDLAKVVALATEAVTIRETQRSHASQYATTAQALLDKRTASQ